MAWQNVIDRLLIESLIEGTENRKHYLTCVCEVIK